MLSRAVRKFLKAPRIARLATIAADGYPHIVPIYFMLDGDGILFGSDRGDRKVRNALANPKGAVIIGGEPTTDEAGYMIRGDLSVEEDEDRVIVHKLLHHYETPAEAEALAVQWAESDLVVIRLTPKVVIRVW